MMPPVNSSDSCRVSGADLRVIVASAGTNIVHKGNPVVQTWWSCCFPGTLPGDANAPIACACTVVPDRDVEHVLPVADLSSLLTMAQPAIRLSYSQFYGLAA